MAIHVTAITTKNNQQSFILGTIGRTVTFAFGIIYIIDCVVNTLFDNYWEITFSKCVWLEVTNIFIDTITNPFAIANFTTNFTSTFYQLLQLKIRWPRFSVKWEYHQRPGFYLLALATVHGAASRLLQALKGFFFTWYKW